MGNQQLTCVQSKWEVTEAQTQVVVVKLEMSGQLRSLEVEPTGRADGLQGWGEQITSRALP